MSETFVLRDVNVQAAVYSLARPGVAAPIPAPATKPVISTLESQLAEKYREGFLAGKTAQAEDSFIERQAAAEEELKQTVALAAQDGYAEGWAKATEEVRVAAEETRLEVERGITALDTLATAMSSQMAAALEGVEDDLVSLCHEVVCRILGEAAPAPEGIRSMVNRALKDLPGELLSIHLHPDDLTLYRAGGGLDERVRWMPDSSVAMGGVVVRSDRGSLDARLETQLQALKETLLAVRAAQRAKPPSQS